MPFFASLLSPMEYYTSLPVPRMTPFSDPTRVRIGFGSGSGSLRFFPMRCTSWTEATSSVTGREVIPASSVNPVYTPTPEDRKLRTPHSGYHFDGTPRHFFEGWYFKVSIPQCRQSFCFMYSVENPAFPNGMSVLDRSIYGKRYTGVGVQILGADDKYICQFSDKSKNFWGSRHELKLGSTFLLNGNSTPPSDEVTPKEFNKRVLEGFQVTPLWNQGFISDDGRSNYVQTVKTARWEYSTKPVYGWGDVTSKQKSTTGWVAAVPVFEHTGKYAWLVVCQQIQCNVFEGTSSDVALTAAGGLRQLSGLSTEEYESPSLIGVHHAGRFYEFVPWTGFVTWDIVPWGYWKMTGENETHLVEIEATTKEPGTPLRAPTLESGLVTACKETCYGDLKLQLWEKKYDGSKGKVILDVTSNMAALEVGGGPWFSGWKGKTKSNELLNRALGAPIDIESFFPIIFLKPPGL